MSNVAKVSITWGALAALSWVYSGITQGLIFQVLLMFATDTPDVNDYTHVRYQSYYWVSVGGLLFIFYVWVFLLRWIRCFNFGGRIQRTISCCEN